MLVLLLGCADTKFSTESPSSSDAVPDSSGAVDTGATDPASLFPPGITVLSAVGAGEACPSSTDAGPELAATVTDAGTVRLEHRGLLVGCAVEPEPPVFVGLDEEARTATVRWKTGDCEVALCVDYVATVRGFPSGIWHLEGDGTPPIDVIVP